MRWETRRRGVTRILIADDHEVVRAGLRRMLESQPSWEVVAEVADGKDAISKAVETKPDIAVLDYSLPLVNGIEATRQIRARLPKTEVLIFTMHDNETLIQDLLKAGARGYLLKTDANHHLINAIEALASHKPFFSAKISEALLELVSCRPDPARICSHQPGTRCGAADRRGAHEQTDRRCPHYKSQNRGDAQGDGHAQASSVIVRRSRAIRNPKQARGGLGGLPLCDCARSRYLN